VTEPTDVSPSAYLSLGLVSNPFPKIVENAYNPFWQRVLTHAVSNRLLSGVVRARANAKPVFITMTEEFPDVYLRGALNEFLAETAADRGLSMMTINATLDIMRLGSIRGTLAEVCERIAASQLDLTTGLYLADVLQNADRTLPEAAALSGSQIDEAAAAFLADPGPAMRRYLGFRATDTLPTREEEFDALHMTYMKGAGLEHDPVEDEDAMPVSEEPEGNFAAPPQHSVADSQAEEEVVHPDDLVRDYLLALVSTDLSPVVARALSGYRVFGENMFAQEMKVTKAPRKTLKAALRLMSYRWKNVVFLWETFDAWPMMEHQTHLDILAALNELRWLFGEYGVMGVAPMKGVAPEVEEAFAGAEQVDWTIPGFNAIYEQDYSWNPELVQSWIDSASIALPSVYRVDGPELAPIVAASEGDVMRFALIAEVAFRDAAARGAASLDSAAIDAAVASVNIEDGA